MDPLIAVILGSLAVGAGACFLGRIAERKYKAAINDFSRGLAKRVRELSPRIREAKGVSFLDLSRTVTHWSLESACSSVLLGLTRQERKKLFKFPESVTVSVGFDMTDTRTILGGYSVRIVTPYETHIFHLRPVSRGTEDDTNYTPEKEIKMLVSSGELVAISAKNHIRVLSETIPEATIFRRTDDQNDRGVAVQVVLERVQNALYRGDKTYIKGIDLRPIPETADGFLNDVLSTVYKLNRYNLVTA